ncbi:SUN domain-containing protein 2 [Heterostelium album PN500]|uniref:SUN domain-containing protein 2 n=1 Tax=Heterostelium pallidum (strain ATCC 26659 / Pp 5 / PN500) TaxID=670386 RepID=D3BIE0_HETP5|nr:SUN domain-containing protein 2 [Heterostelium album PN500]EFA79040.1 SUN domain-containing protein 2 [Heterostelium album PN500]|eukprot:XP_020431163.1 SUN domain-containing protein 2 [Heterostelium album PN500]
MNILLNRTFYCFFVFLLLLLCYCRADDNILQQDLANKDIKEQQQEQKLDSYQKIVEQYLQHQQHQQQQQQQQQESTTTQLQELNVDNGDGVTSEKEKEIPAVQQTHIDVAITEEEEEVDISVVVDQDKPVVEDIKEDTSREDITIKFSATSDNNNDVNSNYNNNNNNNNKNENNNDSPTTDSNQNNQKEQSIIPEYIGNQILQDIENKINNNNNNNNNNKEEKINEQSTVSEEKNEESNENTKNQQPNQTEKDTEKKIENENENKEKDKDNEKEKENNNETKVGSEDKDTQQQQTEIEKVKEKEIVDEENNEKNNEIPRISTVLETVHRDVITSIEQKEKEIEQQKIADTQRETKLQEEQDTNNINNEIKLEPFNKFTQKVIFSLADTESNSALALTHNNTVSNQTSYPTVRTPKDLPDKFNYAGAECGATVLAANSEAREISKLANYEFFSSMFKDFVVMGINKYPSSTWHFLGNFTAENIRKPQYFVLKEKSWYKYLKIKMLTNYGNQMYCTLSDIKVYGSTMIDDLKNQVGINIQEVESILNRMNNNITFGTSSSSKLKTRKENETISWTQLQQVSMNLTQTRESYSPPDKNGGGSGNGNGQSSATSSATEENDEHGATHVESASPQSILQLLANRVKSAEINQSISNKYLEKLETHYSERFRSLDEDFTKIMSVINGIAELGSDLERRVAIEQQSIEKKISQDIAKELNLLRERINRLEQKHEEDKNYYITLLASSFILAIIISYLIIKANIEETSFKHSSLRIPWNNSNSNSNNNARRNSLPVFSDQPTTPLTSLSSSTSMIRPNTPNTQFNINTSPTSTGNGFDYVRNSPFSNQQSLLKASEVLLSPPIVSNSNTNDIFKSKKKKKKANIVQFNNNKY